MSHDIVSNNTFWNKIRIKNSSIYQFPVYQYAKRFIQKHKIQTVIDVGCGVATKIKMIQKDCPGVEFVGIDQESAINYCKSHYDFGSWYIDNFEKPDENLSDIKGELIICSDIIEHVINPDILLNYLKCRVKKNGFVILSTPERDALRGQACTNCPNMQHIREWNYIELEKYLESQGFKIIEHFNQYPIRFVLSWKYFIKFANRFIRGYALKYNQVCLMRVK